MSELEPVHLVIRFADNFGSVDTIESHEEVLQRRGMVWFAKFGKTLGVHYVKRMNEQIKEGVKTYVYFAGRRHGRRTWYQARLAEISRSKPEGSKQPLPAYYKQYHAVKSARLWLRVSSLDLLEERQIQTLIVKSSGFRISETLGRSMAGMFIVVRRESGIAKVSSSA